MRNQNIAEQKVDIEITQPRLVTPRRHRADVFGDCTDWPPRNFPIQEFISLQGHCNVTQIMQISFRFYFAFFK